ncbi:MAG: hypothetical protein KA968_08140 [Chitinophagaceae bacterium]|jgi:hypothetical protein|nr:hypothetical protein [Chitinophagaceae bacterium]
MHQCYVRLGLLDDGDVVTALIITLGCIVITGMVIGYLVWRYGQDIKLETINSQFVKVDDKIKQLEVRVDSLNTKVGARKL